MRYDSGGECCTTALDSVAVEEQVTGPTPMPGSKHFDLVILWPIKCETIEMKTVATLLATVSRQRN